jgi:anti-anti-sigma factor
MEIQQEQLANAKVVRAAGRIDGVSAAGFETTVLACLDSLPGRLVLDLSGVEYVSSAGLRAVLMAAKRAKNTGCTLAVCGLREPVREVFEVSGFGTVIALYSTVDEALRS